MTSRLGVRKKGGEEELGREIRGSEKRAKAKRERKGSGLLRTAKTMGKKKCEHVRERSRCKDCGGRK